MLLKFPKCNRVNPPKVAGGEILCLFRAPPASYLCPFGEGSIAIKFRVVSEFPAKVFRATVKFPKQLAQRLSFPSNSLAERLASPIQHASHGSSGVAPRRRHHASSFQLQSFACLTSSSFSSTSISRVPHVFLIGRRRHGSADVNPICSLLFHNVFFLVPGHMPR